MTWETRDLERASAWPLALLLTAAGCGASEPEAQQSEPASVALRALALNELAAIDAPQQPDEARFEVGRALFFDTRLSIDGTIACHSCHVTEHGGGDGRSHALGVYDRVAPRNAPSVFNVGIEKLWHWRADRENLTVAAELSLLGEPLFGNADEAEVVARARDAGYADTLAAAFPDDDAPLRLANIASALEAYERTLQTPSRFDAFLRGDDRALDAQARAGLQLFLAIGCSDCHEGAAIGGNQLRKFGVYAPYADATGSDPVDRGRADVTQRDADRFVFKVAPLRNVADSAPYFHDGSVADLATAIAVMADVQLGTTLSPEQTAAIAAFLETLSGAPPDWFSPP